MLGTSFHGNQTCLIVSKGTSLHTLKESLTNGSSPRTKLSMGWAGSVRPTHSQTPMPSIFSPTPSPLQTPWPNFNQDGPCQNIKGWCVFPKDNLASLPSRRLHELRGQKTTSLNQSGQFPSSECLALFLTSNARSWEVQSKTDSVGNNSSVPVGCLPPLLCNSSLPALLLYSAFLLLKGNRKLI